MLSNKSQPLTRYHCNNIINIFTSPVSGCNVVADQCAYSRYLLDFILSYKTSRFPDYSRIMTLSLGIQKRDCLCLKKRSSLHLVLTSAVLGALERSIQAKGWSCLMKTDEAEIKCLPTLGAPFITVSPGAMEHLGRHLSLSDLLHNAGGGRQSVWISSPTSMYTARGLIDLL